MRLGRRDHSALLLTSCFLLPLLTMSIVWLNRPKALAAPPQATFVSVPTQNLMPIKPSEIKDDDGDGDELLEHWNNPVFRAEQRKQIAGMAAFFTIAATASAWRARRRRVKHDH